MTAYLITGGAGFIGSHLAEGLVKRGHRVRVLDNFLTGKRENLAHLGDAVEILEGDIRDLETCRRAVAGMEVVFHEAALPSVPRSVEDPFTTNEINIRGTLNMLWAAAKGGVRRLVFASSSSVYGDDPGLPKVEGNEGRPLSPYAVSKWVGEKYLQTFAVTYGLSTVSLRYFNVFGPRQDPFSQYAAAIPLFITRILAGQSPVIYGDGEQSRDFTFIENIIEANIRAAEAPGLAGEALNVACAERITVNALTARIGEILGRPARPVYEPPRPGDIKHSFADISRAVARINFHPLVLFDEGLRRTVQWYKERAKP
ncbi:MAG: SDR family oxidoreductase [Candidatus Aminicenantes bacterium]|nr:SDR family oxidoreductase [Candidatus Aminicenantes bacterium]